LTNTGNTKENRTEWYFELRREINGLADLNQAIRGRIIQEAFKMEDKNGRKRLDSRLLDCLD
jgi:hypothetical protein